MPAIEWPTEEQSQQLFAKLVSGDPAAVADFMTAFYLPLVAHVKAQNRKLDEAAHQDAATEALVSMVKNPGSYHPESALSLVSYLKMSATGDLWNILRKERKHRVGRNPIEVVEPAAEDGNELELADEARHVEATLLPVIRKGLTPEENAGLDLLLASEKSTAAFAAALKLTDENPEAVVKAFKDRMKKRIQRAATEAP